MKMTWEEAKEIVSKKKNKLTEIEIGTSFHSSWNIHGWQATVGVVPYIVEYTGKITTTAYNR